MSEICRVCPRKSVGEQKKDYEAGGIPGVYSVTTWSKHCISCRGADWSGREDDFASRTKSRGEMDLIQQRRGAAISCLVVKPVNLP